MRKAFGKLNTRGSVSFTRRSLLFYGIALGALALPATPASAARGPDACSSMGFGTKMGSATIVVAETVTAGSIKGWDGGQQTGLPPFCRIVAIASPKPSSHILVEVWLPVAEKWNGKFLGTGNGGAAGRIGTSSLAGGLRRGFAVANTDMGTYPAGTNGIGFSFGNGRPEAIRDWAYRSTHEMTVVAKEAIKRYYNKSPQRSYFAGCSTGGHQALMEAQRYPEDYDGIIVGAPAHNRTHLHIRFAALRQLGLTPGAAFNTAQLNLWKAAILKSCAGRDGGAPADTFLTDPLRCSVSPRTLKCASGQLSDSCLTEPQVRALEQIYDGTRNRRTGELIYYADVRGAEDQIRAIYGNTPLSRDFDVTHWILPPNRASDTFDFDKDMAALDARFPDVNAMNADLNRFAARGGKIIFFHGWEDGLISPIDTLDYFRRMSARNNEADGFARLYMVPGLAHCAGGSGPWMFGQLADVPAGTSPQNDLLQALDQWSVGGSAPGPLIVAKYAGFGAPAPSAVPQSTRPVCPYPQIPTYDGRGDATQASSFACVAAPPSEVRRPAAVYLR